MNHQQDREYFEERAAIREFDGGMTRQDAEREARQDVMARMCDRWASAAAHSRDSGAGKVKSTAAAALLLMSSILAGCSTVAGALAGVEDRARESSEWTLCRGISVGAWVRSYGQDTERAQAWRVLCSDPVKEMPGK